MESKEYIDSRDVTKEDIDKAWQKLDCRKLLAHTSHDLRSSLNNVLGLTELAKSSWMIENMWIIVWKRWGIPPIFS